MSIRNEQRHFVVCDDCEAEYYDRATSSAMEARISAGQAGWQFQVSKDRGGPGSGHGAAKGRKVHFDRCPACRVAADPTTREAS